MMNKFTLSYILLVNAAIIALAIADMISGNIFLKYIFFIINSIVSIYCVFHITKKYAYHYLCATNLIQAFSLMLFGFSFKFLLGPDLSFFLYSEGDLKSTLSFKIFNVFLICSKGSEINDWVIGINFIHLFVFFHLFSLISKSKTKISNVA